MDELLRNYQNEAVEKLKSGNILVGGVGAGKTRTALAWYCSCQNDGPGDWSDLYVITTAKKRDTGDWEREMRLFMLSTNPELCTWGCKVVVDSWNNISKYVEISDSIFLFDEDHVTGTGKWVKSFWKIAKRNKWIVITATPGDSYQDYGPILVANGFYKNITDFRRQHLLISWANGHYPKIEGYMGQGRLNALIRRITVKMRYKHEANVHSLDVICEFDRHKYKDLMKNRWNYEENRPIENVSELCYMLRKVCNCAEERQNRLLELLDDIPRAIIFYNFNAELEILRNLAYIDGTEVAELNGDKHENVPISERWVYLVQYTAGAEAWECIETDTIIFYSQTYSYKTLVQARGRIDRLNTPFDELYYYNFRSTAGIDLAIYRALKDKKQFNESTWVKKLS